MTLLAVAVYWKHSISSYGHIKLDLLVKKFNFEIFLLFETIDKIDHSVFFNNCKFIKNLSIIVCNLFTYKGTIENRVLYNGLKNLKFEKHYI